MANNYSLSDYIKHPEYLFGINTSSEKSASTSNSAKNLNPLKNSTYYTSTSSYNPATQSSVLGQDYSNINANDIIENLLSGSKSALNAANSGTSAIDLSGIIADYKRNNQATIDTYNRALENTINTLNAKNQQSRNDLLTSLKRFQESNAESMRTQQQDFNASRATLEDEAFMNQRNAAANAAARGLGGSGLQQLAQLQNRIAAGKDVSTLAIKNQSAQDALRRALKQEQEDYDTKVTNLETNLANAILQAQDETANKINAANTNTTNLINNLIYNEQVRQANAKAQASSLAASLAAQRSDLQNQYNSGITALRNLEMNVENQLKNAKSKSSAKKILNESLNSLFSTDFGLDSSYTDLANQRLNNLYNIYSRYY